MTTNCICVHNNCTYTPTSWFTTYVFLYGHTYPYISLKMRWKVISPLNLKASQNNERRVSGCHVFLLRKILSQISRRQEDFTLIPSALFASLLILFPFFLSSCWIRSSLMAQLKEYFLLNVTVVPSHMIFYPVFNAQKS